MKILLQYPIVIEFTVFLIQITIESETTTFKPYAQVDGETKCTRKCDGQPLTCYYKLTVEPYSTMGPACRDCPYNKTACYATHCIAADGIERAILAYNRKLPGPSIQVCLGDRIVVDVYNTDAHRSTSVHWHGIRQLNTQYSDGAPFVTQCPIVPAAKFRYSFYATDTGSYFYHSHSGIQKLDGLNGPLVIRDVQSRKPFGYKYDYDLPEHVIFIQDWLHYGADQKIPGLRHSSESGSLPTTYLINGRGIFVEKTRDFKKIAQQVNSQSQPPISEFSVQSGKRYRFRIIGSICLACTVKVTIEGHRMSVIHADGAGPITPTLVDGVTLNSGDRFDVIVEAENKIGSYWILVQGQYACDHIMQVAILRYHGSDIIPTTDMPSEDSNFVTLNPTNPTCSKAEDLCITELTAPYPAPSDLINTVADVRLVLNFGFYFYSPDKLFEAGTHHPFFIPAESLLVRGQINGITNKFAPSPLSSQYYDINHKLFCTEKCPQKSSNCLCLNVYKVPLNSVVDLIIADTASYTRSGLAHPFHLHGYNFYVLKEGIFTNDSVAGIQELNEWLDKGAMISKPNAIQRDSIGISSGGYAVLRFRADNPGFWLFHCHLTLHLVMGMSAVLQVGELHEIPPPPHGFPTCEDYLPPI